MREACKCYKVKSYSCYEGIMLLGCHHRYYKAMRGSCMSHDAMRGQVGVMTL